jgi:2-C-methyl-D-erythritol 2,4-cyclodiphosphate synthase
VLALPATLASLRVGHGCDMHRLAPGLPLYLAGVLVEHSPLGAVAHSDGDVVYHALVDALLGAVALGDIGDLFPPSDATWQGAAGSALWRLAVQQVEAQRGPFHLLNVDVTLELEAPKLKSLKATMATQLATVLGLPCNRISIKAKTNEGLGPIGLGQAVAAHVTLLLYLP